MLQFPGNSWLVRAQRPAIPGHCFTIRSVGGGHPHRAGFRQSRRGGGIFGRAKSGPEDSAALEQAEGSGPQELQFAGSEEEEGRLFSTPPPATGDEGSSGSRVTAQDGQQQQQGRVVGRGGVTHQQGDLIGPSRQYRVESVIGSGSNAVTYKAYTEDGVAVAVKMLSLRGMNDWKQLQLFEREASTLRALNHPGIPKYLDYFEEDSEADRKFYLVQELAAGTSLAEMVKAGRLFTEDEILSIAKELLGILTYLGNLRPPVVHRDVKPENIVLDGDAVRLVDFGGVQEATIWGEGMPLGSTVVGTYGYMAPEQFRGAAQPASDLYALGGTLLYLLSGQPPSSFPQARLRIDFQQRVAVGARLGELLTGLLEPLPEDRMTVKQAIAVLEGRRRAAQAAAVPPPGSVSNEQRLPANKLVRRPAGTRATVTRSAATGATVIDIPPAKFGVDTAGSGAFAVMWNVFVGYWTVGALAGGGLLFAAFSAPFWLAGVQLLRSSFGQFLTRSHLEVGPRKWRISTELAALKDGVPSWAGGGSQEVGGDTRDLSRAKVTVSGYVNGEAQTELLVMEGVRQHTFATGMSYQEQEWLASEINRAIEEIDMQGDKGYVDDDDYNDDEYVNI